MRVIYKKTVLDRILDEIHKAKAQRKEIEFILVTPQEFDEIRRDLSCYMRIEFDQSAYSMVATSVIELKDPCSTRTYKYIRTGETIHGVEIVRVQPQHIHWKVIQ